MELDEAKGLILELLKSKGEAKNSEMINLLKGDKELFELVREDLIFNELSEDKKNVGLVYVGKIDDEVRSDSKDDPNEDSPATCFIFMSYGRKDADDLAKRLKEDLVAKGHEVWLDVNEMRAGKEWEHQIEQAIEKCEVFISLLSPHAVRRPDGVCLDEISMARYNGKRLVPIMVSLCKPPLGIYRLDWIDFQEWQTEAGYKKALERLTKEIGSKEQYVEGTYAQIFGTLKPIDFGTRIFELTHDFTGREWLIKELEGWLKNDESRVFFVTGDPGVGKSAVMAHLVEKNPLVNAYHFCLFHLAESTDPGVFIKSISAQLATQIEDYRHVLQGIDDLDDVVKQDADSLFKRLITDPLSKIRQPDSAVLIVIDALDESLSAGRANISSLLRNRLNDLPKWIRLVISSRKESRIIDTFSEFMPHEIDAGKDENAKDIEDYVDKKLNEPKIAELLKENNVNPKQIAESIIQKSENNFLYVTEVIKGIINKTIDLRHPENFPPGLIGLYKDFFNRLFPEGVGYGDIQPLLEIIVASKEPLTREEIAFFMSCDEFDLRGQLAKINTFFPRRDGRYYPYHKSVADWLSGDVGEDATFNINVKRGNNVICDKLVSDKLPESLKKYKLSYLPAHLASAVRLDKLKSILTDYEFMEEKLNQVGVVELIKDYDFLPGDRDLRMVQGSLRLSISVLLRDPNELISQLYGRLMFNSSSVIKNMLDNARKIPRKTWLARNLTRRAEAYYIRLKGIFLVSIQWH